MSKKLTATEYIFTIAFIFMLVCVAAAFFFGVKIGADRTESKYAAIFKKNEEAKRELTAYDQQYLVSFYHTIFTPYREYQKKWFEHMSTIELHSNTADPASLLKELGKLADEKYKAILTMSMPEKSPLLQDAHQNYLKSLKLFSDTLIKYESKANSMPGAALVAEIEKDPFFQEAKNFALKAQNNYYTAIVKWNETANPGLKGTELLGKADMTVKEWSQLNVNLKNAFVSGVLVNQKKYLPYYPQDITVRLDEIIATGQAGKMNLNEIGKMTDMLISTGAVRQGDFIRDKDKWYGSETLPQLPFFYESQ